MLSGWIRARFTAAVVLLFVTTLTACGGSTQTASPLPAANDSRFPLPMAIISQSGSNIELTGSIVGMIAGGFTIQGGTGVGYLHIYVGSSTVIVGPTPYVGESVDVIGTGSPSTSVTASKVSQLGAAATATPAPTASPVPTAAPTAGAPISLPSGVIVATGQIGAISGSKITIQAGAGCGWMNVYVTSSTAYFDGTPQIGQYVAFTGTGTKCNTISAAKSVSLSPAALTSGTTSGTVAAATSYGFTLHTATATIPVALASSTLVYGSTLTVGSNVTVTALGTAATGLTASQVAVAAPPTPTPNPSMSPTPTPAPISTTHVQTFAYIYGYAGTPTTVPIGSISPYVNWTMTDEAHAAALRSAGVKVQVYANFWRNYASDNPSVGYVDLEPGGAHAAAEARDCSGNAVFDPNYGGGYEADAGSSDALAHAQVVTNYRLQQYAPNYDALFSDDSGAVDGITLPCNYVQSTYDSAVNAVHTSLGVPVFINALGAAQNPATAVDLLDPANVLGAMCELCYSANGSSGDSVQTGTSWQNVENAEIGTVAKQKIFWLYGRATGDAATETALRIYTYASFLLTYDAKYAMFQEALSTPSGFPVMPETGLVAMNPRTTATSVTAYQGAGGAYIREFANCYYRGSYVSPCAVVVNPGASTVPVPSTAYAHSLSLSGSGVLDGGSAAFNGPAISSLTPGSAAILFP